MASCPLPIRFRVPLAAAAVVFVLLVGVFVRFHLSGHFNGVFLLSGKGRHVLEVKDDLFLGEGSRLLLAVDFGPVRRAILSWAAGDGEPAGLRLEWDEEEGSGSVRQRFPDGTVLVTNLGRFVEESGSEVHGVFVGGGSAESAEVDSPFRGSDTGMAFFDGKRWYHIWCNMNEAVHHGDETDPRRYSYPYQWRLLGSSVLRDGPRKVVLESSHATEVRGVPLRIDRYAYFTAGETFFRLSIRIRNEGDRPVPVVYLYGDEPWLGDYGSSAGNVGWMEGGLVETVGLIDLRRNRFAGFWDHGNDRVSPRHDFTEAANFIEWLGPNGPDVAWYSNTPGYNDAEARARVPLRSNTRFLGLAWGPRRLAPGEEEVIHLAQGMAPLDPAKGAPVKPAVALHASLD